MGYDLHMNKVCTRCRERRPVRYYQDGIGETAIFNGQPLCGQCADVVDKLPTILDLHPWLKVFPR